MPIPKTEMAKRLILWMRPSTQPAYLSLDHPAQVDIAAAADEVDLLAKEANFSKHP